MNLAKTYSQIITEKGFLITAPYGSSMKPLIRPHLDTVKLIHKETINRLDVVLYLRRNGDYLLHRVIRIKDNNIYLCGDNHWRLETGVTKEQVIAVLAGVYRKEKYVACDSWRYRIYSIVWSRLRFLRWLRDFFKRLVNKIWKRKRADK
jgi:hypothetical protein